MAEHEGPGLVELLHVFARRDADTARHCSRVADYCLKLAPVLGLTEAERQTLYLAARLHDIGKLFIEWEQIRQHPECGEHVAAAANLDAEISRIIRHHHEWWNGEGYPEGLRAQQIPKLARCLAVADAWDALTQQRPYPMHFTFAHARRALQAVSGSQLDPEVVAGFVTLSEAVFYGVYLRHRHPADRYREVGRWGAARG